MKKALLTLVILAGGAAFAAGTYTESVTQKYTQKAVDKETQMRQEAAARQNTAQQAQQQRQNAQAVEAQKRIDTINATQQKVDTKKQQWNDLVKP